MIKTVYVRTSFIACLTNIGSLLYMLRTISNGMVNWLANFGLDNTMIRRLYSIDAKNSDLRKYEYEV